MARKKRVAKPKTVKVKVIDRPTKPEPDTPYEVLDRIVRDHHDGLSMAKIALVWLYDVKADKNANLCLGKARKASDLDREFSMFDIVIFLNYQVWGELTPRQREALIDHECMHVTPTTDDQGEYKMDDRGRIVYRMRHHDIEEFRDVVKRHGLYLSNLQEFYKTIQAAPLFKDECQEPLPGLKVVS
jgi:hypothetical protein